MFTFGHGRLGQDDLSALLTDAGIKNVIDIRRNPGSRSNPAAARGEIPKLVKKLKGTYTHDARLGGRRSLSPEEEELSPDTWWQIPSFRAYAAWTRSPEFRMAIPAVAKAGDDAAIMGSENVWWRCHRRLVSDILVLEYDVKVRHLLHDGRIADHEPSPGARLDDEGHVVWDGHL